MLENFIRKLGPRRLDLILDVVDSDGGLGRVEKQEVQIDFFFLGIKKSLFSQAVLSTLGLLPNSLH